MPLWVRFVNLLDSDRRTGNCGLAGGCGAGAGVLMGSGGAADFVMMMEVVDEFLKAVDLSFIIIVVCQKPEYYVSLTHCGGANGKCNWGNIYKCEFKRLLLGSSIAVTLGSRQEARA